MNRTASDIRSRLMDFWFGDPINTTDPDGEMKPFWFHSTPEYDQELRINFEEAYVQPTFRTFF